MPFRAAHIAPCHHRAGNHSPFRGGYFLLKLTGVCLFRTAETADTLVMGLFSGSGSPSTILFSGGLSVMYLFSVTCWVPDTRAPHAHKTYTVYYPGIPFLQAESCSCTITRRNTLAGELARELAGKSRLKRGRSEGKQPLYGQKTDPFCRKGPGLSAHRVDHRRQHIGTRREGVPDELRGGLVPFNWKGLKRV